jgi:hypothetical protein
MLARIVHPSPRLVAFLNPLCGALSQPQKTHLHELCDALLVCESDHTLAAMQRLFVATTDASNWADFLRISPWQPDAVRAELLKAQIEWAVEQGQKTCQVKEIHLNFDDSLGVKHDTTWRLDVVDWQHDHARSTPQRPCYKKAFCYVACTMCVGSVTVTLDVRLYLRQRTLRALNRKRAARAHSLSKQKSYRARDVTAPRAVPAASLASHCAIRQLVCFRSVTQVCPTSAVAFYLRREVQSQAQW